MPLETEVDRRGRVTREDDGRGWTTTIRHYSAGRRAAFGLSGLLAVACLYGIVFGNDPYAAGALVAVLFIVGIILALGYQKRVLRIRVSNGQFYVTRWMPRRPVAQGLVEEAGIEHNAYGPNMHMINIHHLGELLYQVYPATNGEAILLTQALEPLKSRRR